MFSEIADSEKTIAAGSSNQVENATIMVERYLAFPLVAREEDPLLWWRCNSAQLDLLAGLPKKYLSSPASSVPSEQLFSGAGNIYSDHR